MTFLRNRKKYNCVEKKYLHDDGGSVNHEKRDQYGDSSKAQKLMCYLIPLPYFYICIYVYIKRSEINIPKDISLTVKFIITLFIVYDIESILNKQQEN